MKKWQKKIHDQVLDRDGSLCVDCNSWTSEVHHIVPRSLYRKGSKAKLCWRLENMATLCPKCHQGAANTGARHNHVCLLAEQYNYRYTEWPWTWLLTVKEGDDEVA